MANVNKIEQYNKGTVFPDSYEETYLATKHISDIKLTIPSDIFAKLKQKIEEKGLYFGEDSILRNIIAGIIKGNIILQGPPGTGKTTLAKIICDVFDVSYTEATANSDWTTYDSIGGLQPSANDEGQEVLEGKNGYVVSSILRCCDLIVKNENDNGSLQANWLILDELNRCEIDKVFGDLFTALGSDASITERIINLWYQKDENKKIVYIPNRYRIIGAMNNIDKNFVNDISQGLSRRFTFIDIMPPQEVYFQNEAKNAKKLAMIRVIDKIKEFGTEIINKALYYFCDEKSQEKTAIEQSLVNSLYAKSKTVHRFEDLSQNGAQAFMDDISYIYHHYCQGRLLPKEDEEENRNTDLNLNNISDQRIVTAPKSVVKNIDKCKDYIHNLVFGYSRGYISDENTEAQTSELDEWGNQFLEVLFGDKTIKSFNTGMFLEALAEEQDEDYHSLVRQRWNAIGNRYR